MLTSHSFRLWLTATVLASLSLLRPSAASAEAPALVGVVNINTAAPAELELLPGVGPKKARLIVEYRQRHAFRTVEELARVKGIGPRTVQRLRAHLVVRGPTTAEESRRGRRRGEPDGVSAAGVRAAGEGGAAAARAGTGNGNDRVGGAGRTDKMEQP